MSMGMMMLSPVLISLPFKLMLFVLVDRWTLLIRFVSTELRRMMTSQSVMTIGQQALEHIACVRTTAWHRPASGFTSQYFPSSDADQ
jgi:hypothetical protein